jgi:tRNA 2-thiocytidine biosynthesis protein TtcA
MNMFHGSRLAAMPPKLLNEQGDLFIARSHMSPKQVAEKIQQLDGYPSFRVTLLLGRRMVCNASKSRNHAAGSVGNNSPGRRQRCSPL